MGKNQIFRKKVPLELINNIIICFGIDNINDRKPFTRKLLLENNTISKLLKYIPELKLYYIPCKARNYLNNLNEKKIITILRQLLKTINYSLISKEKYFKGDKYLIYSIFSEKDKINPKHPTFTNVKKKIVINFD